nr:unnamed protein product [Callosobruchus analis]
MLNLINWSVISSRFILYTFFFDCRLSKSAVGDLLCNVCGEKFQNEHSLQLHIFLRHVANVFKCNLCDRAFLYHKTLSLHKESVHGNSDVLSCQPCNRTFTFIRHLDTHHIVDHDGFRYICKHCSKELKSRDHFRRHQSCHDEIRKMYPCDQCQAVLISIHSFRSHKRRMHSNLGKKVCDECGKAFTNLQLHKRLHTGEKPYKCDVCNARFAHSSNFKDHKLTHTKERTYVCDMCGRSFYIYNCLKQHIKYHSKNKKDPDKKNEAIDVKSKIDTKGKLDKNKKECVHCHKLFSQYFLKIHIRTQHQGLRPHSCKICFKTFTQSGTLAVHTRILLLTAKDELQYMVPDFNTTEDEWRCGICDEVYASLANLKRHHTQRHTAEQEHECPLCNDTFRTQRQLAVHKEKVHRTEYRFYCYRCERYFDCQSSLDKHTRIEHEGFRYECEFCDRSFKDIRLYRQHVATHSKDYIAPGYRCNVCDKVIHTKSGMRKHKLAHAGSNKTVCDVCGKAFLCIADHKSSTPAKSRSNVKIVEKISELRVILLFTDVCILRKNPTVVKYVTDENHQCWSNPTVTGLLKSIRKEGFRFYCKPCKKKFFCKKQLEMHTKIEHERLSYECQQCHKTFKDEATLNLHVFSHQKDKVRPFSCTECKKEFCTVANIFGSEDEVVCPECLKVFKSRRNLYWHTQQVHNRRNPARIACKVCEMTFETRILLKDHLKASHMDDEGGYKCDLCGKSFSGLIKLRSHIDRFHQKIKKYICHECDRGFYWSKDLEEHNKVEHGGFRYICEYCKKEFKNKYSFKAHVEQHEAPKEFVCKICNKELSSRCSLHTHRLVHKDELDICNVCGKAVKCMKSHLLTHSGETVIFI